jgi:AraC-like DNA-binding protein
MIHLRYAFGERMNPAMAGSDDRLLLEVREFLQTESVAIRNVACNGACRHRSDVECASATHFVFPYRGTFVRHVGSEDTVADANCMVIFNPGQSYQISHPVSGGDDCLSIMVAPAVLDELSPPKLLADRSKGVVSEQSLPIGPRSQALSAILTHGLRNGRLDALEAEIVALDLVRRCLGEGTVSRSKSTPGRRKIVERTKLILMKDVARRWTLGEIAAEVGVSMMYLCQVFSEHEGIPLYRYHRQLRLARALDLLPGCDDLTGLALDLGFCSHSHFASQFRKQYGNSPSAFQSAIA